MTKRQAYSILQRSENIRKLIALAKQSQPEIVKHKIFKTVDYNLR